MKVKKFIINFVEYLKTRKNMNLEKYFRIGCSINRFSIFNDFCDKYDIDDGSYYKLIKDAREDL